VIPPSLEDVFIARLDLERRASGDSERRDGGGSGGADAAMEQQS